MPATEGLKNIDAPTFNNTRANETTPEQTPPSTSSFAKATKMLRSLLCIIPGFKRSAASHEQPNTIARTDVQPMKLADINRNDSLNRASSNLWRDLDNESETSSVISSPPTFAELGRENPMFQSSRNLASNALDDTFSQPKPQQPLFANFLGNDSGSLDLDTLSLPENLPLPEDLPVPENALFFGGRDSWEPPQLSNSSFSDLFAFAGNDLTPAQPNSSNLQLNGFDNTRLVANGEVIRGSAPRNVGISGCHYSEAHAQELKANGVNLVVSLNEHTATGLENLSKAGIKHIPFKTPDFTAQPADVLKKIAETIRDNDKGVTYLHCGAGKGRTGMAFTAYEIVNGDIQSMSQLEQHMRQNKVEEKCQEESLKQLFLQQTGS